MKECNIHGYLGYLVFVIFVTKQNHLYLFQCEKVKYYYHMGKYCRLSREYLKIMKVCDLCLAQADYPMPIKRDYRRNGQLHNSTHGCEDISLCLVQSTLLHYILT